MLSTGGSAVIAKKTGEKDLKSARENFTFFIVIGIIISIIISILTIIFLKPLINILGASENLYNYCNIYLKILILFAPACALQTIFQSFFVTAGKPNLGLNLVLIGGILNAILDYIFLSKLNLGIEGAAIATGIGQLIPSIFGVIYFTFIKKELYFVSFKFDLKTLLQAASNGSSEMVSNLSTAVVTYLFNIILMKLAGEAGVAAITIILYGQFLFNSLYLGFSIGVAPIISYNFGANNNKELKKIYKISTNFVIISSLIVALGSYFLSDTIVNIFVSDVNSETYKLTHTGLMLFSINYIFSAFNIFSSSLFTALSDGKISAIISFARTFVFMIISLTILPKIIGLTGVWIAVPLAELITFILSIYYNKKYKNIYNY